MVMADEELREFVFEEHILRVDDVSEKIDDLEKLIGKRRSYPIRKILKARLEELKRMQRDRNEYDEIRDVFECTTNNPNNTLSYDPERHRVIIRGSGTEIFKCNGDPSFYRRDNTEISLIPVDIGVDEALLMIYRYPQVDFPSFFDLDVSYKFETNLSLGGYWKDKFTNNQKQIWAKSDYSKPLFCGEPGKVYFRRHDALGRELLNSMTGNGLRDPSLVKLDGYKHGREGLDLFGKIYVRGSNELLYTGNFECFNTSFPFYVVNDERRGERKVSIKPAGGVSMPI